MLLFINVCCSGSVCVSARLCISHENVLAKVLITHRKVRQTVTQLNCVHIFRSFYLKVDKKWTHNIQIESKWNTEYLGQHLMFQM